MEDTHPCKALEACLVLRHNAWRPSLEAPKPDLGFVEARLRRRLSMLSSMALHVLHGLGPLPPHTPLFFASFRGELAQQLKINKMLVEEGALLPAAFSLSVFNTPPALCSMALGLCAGYSALYPPEGRFSCALVAAAAALQAPSGPASTLPSPSPSPLPSGMSPLNHLAFVYAEEALGAEYASLQQGIPGEALAFALLLAGPVPPGEKEAGGPTTERGGFRLSRVPPGDCACPGRFLAALEAAGGGGGE
ncbi:MAG: beta-ketoacyl synthase chain length factor, partial [Cystobacterineae bacterium]|nr:beta-ketoacyl synthase chain length factor [Cystobacterineae bacterium]